MKKAETELMADWNRTFAEVLAGMEARVQSEEIARVLVGSLRILSPSESGGAWLCPGGAIPHSLYQDVPSGNEPFHELYTRGLYRIDPVRRAGRSGFTGCTTIRDLAPDDFEHTEYWAQMYQAVGIVDEFIHFLPVPNGWIQLHLARMRGEQMFTPAEVARHRAIFPALLVAIRSFGCFEIEVEASDLAERVEAVYEGFGSGLLTAREQEVVRLVLEGHNSESIAHALEIAINTVRELRQRSYRKLGVRTQGQLFSRFLEGLSTSIGAE